MANLHASTTPVQIVPRKMNFDLASSNRKYWFNNSPVETLFLNGLSLSLPIGEHFFIDSVRHYENDITDPDLKREIKQFVAQEAIHTKEHHKHNDYIKAQGYKIDHILETLENDFDHLRKILTPIEQLACTCALEHFTGVMGDMMFKMENAFEHADPNFKAIWFWHAVEEVEHKAVCFDVYKSVGGTWATRIKAMMKMSKFMFSKLAWIMEELVKQDPELKDKKIRAALTVPVALSKVYGSKGTMAVFMREYMQYFKPNFHPWNHDNRKVIDQWKAAFEKDYMVSEITI